MSNWNNQQQYSNYHQHTPGVQQPQWQAPPRQGWGDPRLQQQNQQPVSPASPYNPNAFGHISGQQWQTPPPPTGAPTPPFSQSNQQSHLSSHDTSSWGVKYNQNQQQQQQQQFQSELRPPLPPRPPSAASGDYGGWDGRPAQSQKPPTPPPRPPQYATPPQPVQGHYYPHDQYSNRPSSHHYDPPPPQNWSQPPPQHPQQHQQTPSAPSWHHLDGPVSPIEPEYGRWSQNPPPQQDPNQQQHAQAQHAPPPQHYQAPPSQHAATQIGPSLSGNEGLPNWQQLHPNENYYEPHQQQQAPPPRRASGFVVTPEQIHASPVQTPQSKPQQQAQGPLSQQNTSQSQRLDQPALQGAVAGMAAAAGRQRIGSESSVSSLGVRDRTGTIDSVIQAWNAPALPSAPSQHDAVTSAHPQQIKLPIKAVTTSTAQTQTDFPPLTKIETKTETREIDPYADLKEHYRTSLDRYASMLRQEVNAKSEQEKMKVIVDFINREIKLRSVLYGTEAAELITSTELGKLRRDADLANRQQQPTVPAPSLTIPPPSSHSNSAATQVSQTQPRPTESPILKDDSFVMVNKNDDDDDAEFSPGGRPRIKSLRPEAQSHDQPLATTSQPSNTLLSATDPPSPASNAPMVLEDYDMTDTAYNHEISRPSSTTSQALQQKTDAAAPINFQPARPAYTPFKYIQPEDVPQPTVTAANPADQAYTKLRHEQAADSGRILGQEAPSVVITPSPDRSQNATPSRAKQQQQEAFIGLLRQQSKAVRNPPNTSLPDAPGPLRAGSPFKAPASVPPLVKASDSTKAMLPDLLPPPSNPKDPHTRLAPIIAASAAINNDFSFIHATVLEWDKDNRKHRAQLDKDRADRESENQARTDQMFHDNEIGYADIAGLEEDFKLEEASKKYQEDQSELDSFTKSVFDKVTQRLDKEVAELEKLHVQTLEVLDSDSVSTSGRIRLAVKQDSTVSDKVPLADVMDLLLKIYNKIEMRETKLAEARFERERRRKRLELTVLYANGDTAGVKKLEKEFDKAQSMQVLAEARKKDERANKLMDSFDRAVVRGLSENQAWIDDVSNKVSLLRDLVLGSEANGPQGSEREELLYGNHGIKETVSVLADAVNLIMQDSRDLVNMSNQADKILNEADFAMFLAEAKIADAEDSEFEKLKNEKAKEDLKLKAEFENRMNGINHGPEEILSYVKDVRDYIGQDPNHQARIASALEAAKKRNEAGTS